MLVALWRILIHTVVSTLSPNPIVNARHLGDVGDLQAGTLFLGVGESSLNMMVKSPPECSLRN